MKIVQIAAEMAPFVKVGGLGDVTYALNRALAELGHNVHLILPFYKALDRHGGKDMKRSVSVPFGGGEKRVGIWSLDYHGITVILLREDEYFWRPGVYGEDAAGYRDNLERYAVFSRASIETIKALGLSPEIVHCHDWHVALAPVYLRALSGGDFPRTSVVMTIHNMGYQGTFPGEAFPLLGLPADLFSISHLEFYGQVNILKGGIVFSDAVTTVSPTYAQEIQTPEAGFGLDGVLRAKGQAVHGILNGIDVHEWNPRTDHLLPARYDLRGFKGKAQCKTALQESMGLDKDPRSLLAGMIARLVDHKGLDILLEAFDEIVSPGVQFVILGRGDRKYEEALAERARRHPGRVAVRIDFDNSLAHLIEAGSDIFLMPSKYEPCGLNQMMSLRYGTVPVVRRTGGLKDTIREFDRADGTGNGFTFEEYSPRALVGAVGRAAEAFKDGAAWRTIMKNGMKEDHSWAASARAYLDLYAGLLSQRH